MKKTSNLLVATIGFALSFLWLVPLIWLVGTAFSKPSFAMTIIPKSGFTFENIRYVWGNVPFGRYYLNTTIIVIVTFTVQ